jgi:hypothetical protein
MQSYRFEKEEISEIEKIIFKFLWSKSDTQNGVDRIKRSIMKNDHTSGGMSISDIECLNRSLKLRQFIRARNSRHAIAYIQTILTGSVNILFEYTSINTMEAICEIAQETINIITDYQRSVYEKMTKEEYESDTITIDEIAAINLKKYFKRKSKTFISCMLVPLTKNEIHTLGELVQAFECENNTNRNKSMKMILMNIPNKFKEISECQNENFNSDDDNMKSIMISKGRRVQLNNVTVKQLQCLLKIALGKVESLDARSKLGINTFDENNILNFRSNCKNPKLRNIYFRLIHNDFFTYARMKKYKMTNSDKCIRCDEIENTKHLLWECSHVRNIWTLFNNFMTKLNCDNEKVLTYEDVFIPGKSSSICIIKIRLIQELIQMDRPKNWTDKNIEQICIEIMKIEKYNAIINRTIFKFESKWQNIQNQIMK